MCFLQVRTFYTQVLNEEERQRLCQNMAGSLKGAQLFIQKRMVSPSTTVSHFAVAHSLCFLECEVSGKMLCLLVNVIYLQYVICLFFFMGRRRRCVFCLLKNLLSSRTVMFFLGILQVENLKAAHPDYGNRVETLLKKYNAEAKKVNGLCLVVCLYTAYIQCKL